MSHMDDGGKYTRWRGGASAKALGWGHVWRAVVTEAEVGEMERGGQGGCRGQTSSSEMGLVQVSPNQTHEGGAGLGVLALEAEPLLQDLSPFPSSAEVRMECAYPPPHPRSCFLGHSLLLGIIPQISVPGMAWSRWVGRNAVTSHPRAARPGRRRLGCLPWDCGRAGQPGP